jgi:epoxyqueuosine reductase QueG
LAAASDPLFATFKEVVGPQQLSPAEAFSLTYATANPGARSVVSVVLPVAEAIRRANARARGQSAPSWTLLRSGTDRFLGLLAQRMVHFLGERGHRAVAPSQMPAFRTVRNGKDLTSTWSERHVAFAAGLGTFSVNDGFITDQGMAVRLVSVVTDAELQPTSRPDRGVYGYCRLKAGKPCGACIRRCPVGALSAQGHDKLLCYNQCYGEAARALAAERGGIPSLGTGCGLCQTGVPCEARNPMAGAF